MNSSNGGSGDDELAGRGTAEDGVRAADSSNRVEPLDGSAAGGGAAFTASVLRSLLPPTQSGADDAASGTTTASSPSAPIVLLVHSGEHADTCAPVARVLCACAASFPALRFYSLDVHARRESAAASAKVSTLVKQFVSWHRVDTVPTALFFDAATVAAANGAGSGGQAATVLAERVVGVHPAKVSMAAEHLHRRAQPGQHDASRRDADHAAAATATAAAAAENGDSSRGDGAYRDNGTLGEQQLERLIRARRVMLFMKGTPATPRCGFSRQMVELLREHGPRRAADDDGDDDDKEDAFGTFDILTDERVRQQLKRYSNWPTYPQLYVDGELIGGLDVCRDMAERGELREL